MTTVISGNYDVRPIDDWVRMFAVVPLFDTADNDAAIVRLCKSQKTGHQYLYCFRCSPMPCNHVQAVEDLGYQLEEL